MNCTQVERLLPLAAGGDLEAASERDLTAHLASCGRCRALADEWAESRALLLRAYEPPEFDAAFYDSVRHGVLREIGRAPRASRPAFAGFLALLFDRRALALASTAALLLVAGALAFRLSRVGTPYAPADALARVSRNARPGSPSARHTRAAQGQRRGESPAHASSEPGGRAARLQLASRTPPPASASDAQTARSVSPPRGAAVGAASAAALKEVTAIRSAPPHDPARDAAAQTDIASFDDRKVMRIELHTADPNVRIIWLSPQAAVADSPKK